MAKQAIAAIKASAGKDVALFATSVLLQRDDADGATTTSHTLHWITAQNHDDAIASAIKEAKRLKPELDVVDVVCGNTESGASKRVAFSDNKSSADY